MAGNDMIMLIALAAGAIIFWPKIQEMLNSGGDAGAGAGDIATDTAGGGEADADTGGDAAAGEGGDFGYPNAQEMIRNIRSRAQHGSTVNQMTSIRNGHISVKGKGAKACVNGVCKTGLALSNVT